MGTAIPSLEAAPYPGRERHRIGSGVGTGRNLGYYSPDVHLIGIDICLEMLKRASRRVRSARCTVELRQEDATVMESVPSEHCVCIVATFLCCVMPDELQPLAIKQFERVLKPGGRFRLLEMVYSANPAIRKRQDFFAPFVERLYGARFDRDTVGHVASSSRFKIVNTFFLKEDVYLVIEGVKVHGDP